MRIQHMVHNNSTNHNNPHLIDEDEQLHDLSAHDQPDRVLTQLKRIRGQLDGLVSMYGDNRACVDIVRQVIAARNSLGRVARDLLTNEACRCSRERRAEDLDEILKEIFRY